MSAKQIALDKEGNFKEERYELGESEALLEGASVYSFQDGIQTLVTALERLLGSKPNIEILKNTGVSSLRPNENNCFEASPPFIKQNNPKPCL